MSVKSRLARAMASFWVWMALVAVILLSMRASAFAEEWVPMVPQAGQTFLYYWREGNTSYMNVSIEFSNTGHMISDWGTPSTFGDIIAVEAQIWSWTGISAQVMTEEHHTYNLGNLGMGEYHFNFKVWGTIVKTIAFAVTDLSTVGEVKLRGTAVSSEEWGDFVCYGSYYCNVMISEVVSDPNGLLSVGDVIPVCYNHSLGIETGNLVECYGYYWKGLGPMQSVGKIECKQDSYYAIPELSTPIMILFMIATLLAVIVIKKSTLWKAKKPSHMSI